MKDLLTLAKIGAFIVGAATVLALVVALIGLSQNASSSESQAMAQATLVSVLQEQLEVQREMATIAASGLNSGPTATAIARRAAELEATSVALTGLQANVEATLTAAPISRPPTATPQAKSTEVPQPTPTPCVLFDLKGSGVLGDNVSSLLVSGSDGKIYGVDEDYGVYSATAGRDLLFDADPLDGAIHRRGPLPDRWVTALISGMDGKLYGGGAGSGSAPSLWKYDPASNDSTILGQVPGGRSIIGLAISGDGLIYVGTENNQDVNDLNLTGRLYAFDPATGTFSDKGATPNAGSFAYGIGHGLAVGPDGKIYGGTFPTGHLFLYDPSKDQLLDKGQPVAGTQLVTALVVGNDGKIYGGADGHLFSYDPTSGAFSDKGEAVKGQRQIRALTIIGNEIYGGTFTNLNSDLSAHLFKYDLVKQSFTDLGVPAAGQHEVGGLVRSSPGTIYFAAGHLFAYNLAECP